jgi:hypothetical protein
LVVTSDDKRDTECWSAHNPCATPGRRFLKKYTPLYNRFFFSGDLEIFMSISHFTIKCKCTAFLELQLEPLVIKPSNVGGHKMIHSEMLLYTTEDIQGIK